MLWHSLILRRFIDLDFFIVQVALVKKCRKATEARKARKEIWDQRESQVLAEDYM